MTFFAAFFKLLARFFFLSHCSDEFGRRPRGEVVVLVREKVPPVVVSSSALGLQLVVGFPALVGPAKEDRAAEGGTCRENRLWDREEG